MEGTDDLSQYFSRVGKTWFLIPLALSLRQFPQVAGEWLLSQEFKGIKQCVLPDKSTTRIPWSEDPCLPMTALSAMLGSGLSAFGLSLTDGLRRYGTQACLPWLIGGLCLASLTERLRESLHLDQALGSVLPSPTITSCVLRDSPSSGP